MNIAEVVKSVRELAGKVNIIDVIFCVAGVLLLSYWLLRTSLGRRSLVESLPRRNNMPFYLPLVPIFAWFGTVWLLAFAKEMWLGDLLEWQGVFAENLIICIGVAPATAITLLLAWGHFARRLKGFGLDPKTIGRDFLAALVNLLAIMPVVLALIVATTLIGKLIVGPQFEMPQHEELKQISSYTQLSLRALILFATILVIPLAEELLFRGMLQTAIRSFVTRPWPAVIFSSLIFVVFHQNPQHWPALFALSVCLGYAYEKSGSLFRPILIHSLFNGVSVLAALSQ